MNPIKSIKLNQTRIMVALENKIHIYDYDMNEITTIIIPNNIEYMISPTAENPYLAASSKVLGGIYIYEMIYGKFVNSFKAHENTIHKICFNERGNMLATTSIKVYT